MGSGISLSKESINKGELICPKDYDNDKFNKILQLYDKLDKNGDMIIEEDELYILTIHHIKNKKKILEKEKLVTENTKNQKLLAIRIEYESLKKNLEIEFEKKKEKYHKNSEEKIKEIDNEILKLNHLSKKEKYEIFKNKFCDKDNKLEFKLFFEYMKDKTNDIKNIDWKSTGKLNYILSPKNPTVKISSPNNRPRLLSSP